MTLKKFCIRETKHLSTNADISTDTKKRNLLVRQNLPKKTIFEQQIYTPYKQKFSNLRPFLYATFPQGFQKSKKFGHWTLGSGAKKTVKWSGKLRYQKNPAQYVKVRR